MTHRAFFPCFQGLLALAVEVMCVPLEVTEEYFKNSSNFSDMMAEEQMQKDVNRIPYLGPCL